jgi:hypothetical protein
VTSNPPRSGGRRARFRRRSGRVHACSSGRTRAGDRRNRSVGVVGDRGGQAGVRVSEPDPGRAVGRVLRGVGEGLLDDPIRRQISPTRRGLDFSLSGTVTTRPTDSHADTSSGRRSRPGAGSAGPPPGHRRDVAPLPWPPAPAGWRTSCRPGRRGSVAPAGGLPRREVHERSSCAPRTHAAVPPHPWCARRTRPAPTRTSGSHAAAVPCRHR